LILVFIYRGRLVEENAYYPYGLKIAALSSKAFDAPKNLYLYQGDYAEFDEESGYNEFELRNYDPQIGRFIQADPFEEFPSLYTGMGNDPVNNVDPSGGSILSGITGVSNIFFNTAVASIGGAMVGGIVGMFNGDENAWKKGAAIGAGLGLLDGVGSGIYNQLSNLGTTLPTVGGSVLSVLASPTTVPLSPTAPPGTQPNSMVRVYVKHGKTKADGGDNSWDVWDRHTLLQVDNMVYHFYPTKMRGGKDLDPSGLNENGNSDSKIDMKETWNSTGEVGTMDMNTARDYLGVRQSLNYGFSVFETSITPTQKTALLQNINNSIANPPNYKTLGTRCQSWVSGMLRSSNILTNSVRKFSWSTVPFSKSLFKLPKFNLVFKSLSAKAP
jgi:RHS repeat-associated protein